MSAQPTRCKLCAVEQILGGQRCSYHARRYERPIPFRQSAESAFRAGLPERYSSRGSVWANGRPPRRQRRKGAA